MSSPAPAQCQLLGSTAIVVQAASERLGLHRYANVSGSADHPIVGTEAPSGTPKTALADMDNGRGQAVGGTSRNTWMERAGECKEISKLKTGL